MFAHVASTRHVVLVPGSMNPPHRGHLSIALHACRYLAGTVEAIYLLPAHDNLLHNQCRAGGDTPCWDVEARCEMLRGLIVDAAEDDRACPPIHVVAYESEHASQLLCNEPGEWAAHLPDGYCKTVPLAELLQHFAASSLAQGARLAVVVGTAHPVNAHADVLLLPRAREAAPGPAEVLLPALGAEEAALSSKLLRRVISERNLDEGNLRTLSAHGYHGASVDAALRAAFSCTSELWLEQVSEGAKCRGEWVEPLGSVFETFRNGKDRREDMTARTHTFLPS